MKIFAERITKLRDERGIKQAEAARQMEHFIGSAQVLSAYEHDKRDPSLETVVEFAKHYGVTTDFLLGMANEERPQSKEICDKTFLSPLAVTNLLHMGDHSDLGGDPNCLWALNNMLEGLSDVECSALVSIAEFLDFAPLDSSVFLEIGYSAQMDPERIEKLTNGALEQQILSDLAGELRKLRNKYYSKK